MAAGGIEASVRDHAKEATEEDLQGKDRQILNRVCAYIRVCVCATCVCVWCIVCVCV